MKKFLSVLLCAALLTACGCSGDEKKPAETLVTTEAADMIEVPDFSELSWEQIEMRYRKYNITPEYEYNDKIAEGDVISQSPDAGTKIKDTDNITIKISLGGKLVEIDDYTNRNIEDAEELLDKQGLKCEIIKEESETVTENCVIRTSPAAREKVERGSVVTCYVSMGSADEEILMPDLTGKSIEEATQIATETGNIGLTIVYDNDSDLPPGTVISQSYEPDEPIEAGTKIEVTISGERAASTGKTNISVTMKQGLSGEFQLKYYVDGTLQDDKTEIKELSLTKKIDWEVSGKDVHTYSIVVVCMANGESGVLYEMEVDFTQDPPSKNHHDTFNANIFSELQKKQ